MPVPVQTSKARLAPPSRAARAIEAHDSPAPSPILEHPDGYYWQTADGRQQFGPFESFEAARENRDADSDESLAPGETLHAIEDEIGMASWLDAETGAPAEGATRPHLPQD